jgi:NAD(P)-dependent dehydrogenase (short-subunit alcohol dehydrogenase family)
MSSPWIFICPCSRGIGFALTRHLLKTTTMPILATTRHPNTESTKSAILADLATSQSHTSLSSRLHLATLDVTSPASVEAAAQMAGELFPRKKNHLHLSFAMPGVLTPEKSMEQIDAASSMAMFQVNALGPMLLAKYFAGFLPRRSTEAEDAVPKHATWVFMSARVGSVTENKSGGWFSYRASKAAVNSVAKSMDIMLQARSGDKALAMAYHPGTVKTGLSEEFWGRVPEKQLFSPEYAVERMVDVVNGLHLGQRGRCWDWKGDEIPP